MRLDISHGRGWVGKDIAMIRDRIKSLRRVKAGDLKANPNTRQVRYIGNSVNPKARLRVHVQEAKAKQNTEKKAWIKSLLDRDELPVLVLVATYDNEPEARRRESREVHEHKTTITNLHDPARGAKDIRKPPEQAP